MSGNHRHHWLTMHRVRYARPVDQADMLLGGPATAECWRVGRDARLATDGLPVSASEHWGAFGIYEDRAAAETVLTSPTAHLPFLEDATEAWHALLLPFSHRGEVNWRGRVEISAAIRVGKDPGGPLAVLTTAGHDLSIAGAMPRLVEFVRRTYAIRSHFEGLPGNLRSALMTPGDACDGTTFTLWQEDAAMLRAAYAGGLHAETLAQHRERSMLDRASFTRARVVASRGTWGGCDPVRELVEASRG
ncbi:MAG: hypothetical protein AB7O21_00500 [Gammaproteobacteria bacterium]